MYIYMHMYAYMCECVICLVWRVCLVRLCLYVMCDVVCICVFGAPA